MDAGKPRTTAPHQIQDDLEFVHDLAILCRKHRRFVVGNDEGGTITV